METQHDEQPQDATPLPTWPTPTNFGGDTEFAFTGNNPVTGNTVTTESHTDFIARHQADIAAKQKAIADRTAAAITELKRARAEAQNKYTTDIEAMRQQMEAALASYDSQLAQLGEVTVAPKAKRGRKAKKVVGAAVKAVKVTAPAKAKVAKKGKKKGGNPDQSARMTAYWAAKKAAAAAVAPVTA